MSDERFEIAPSELARWLVVAGLIVAGLALYFWLAPGTPSVIDLSQPQVTP